MRLCIVALFIDTVLRMMADDQDHGERAEMRWKNNYYVVDPSVFMRGAHSERDGTDKWPVLIENPPRTKAMRLYYEIRQS